MKKIIFFILLAMTAMASSAQFNVYARMFGITNGIPQKIVMESTGEVFSFDKEGRLTLYTIGENEIRYSWHGNKITLTAYQNGNKIGEDYMTVISNTDREILLSLPDGTVKETYRANGSEDQSILSSNGQSMVETCFYNSEEERSPYKVTQTFQGQTETILVSGYEFDVKGNWIKSAVKSNGQTMTEIRTITYYK